MSYLKDAMHCKEMIKNTDMDTRKEEITMTNNQETTMTMSTYANEFNQFTPKEFKHPLFGNLNVLKDSNGKLWFIGVEVARCLGYQNPYSVLTKKVPSQYKRTIDSRLLSNMESNPLGGNPNKTLISEQGLIELIGNSDLNNPVVRQFKDWANNVIVDMRQYGISMSDAFANSIRNCNDIDELRNMVLTQREALQEAQPAIHMYHQATNDDATITTKQIADNYGWTAQKLNTILYKLGFHYPSGDGWVLYEKYKQCGLVSTCKRQTEDGVVEFTNLVDQILHDNGYKTRYESQDDIDRRIQIANDRAMNNNNICAQPYQINNFNYFFSSNPDETFRQINSISDPNVREDAKRAFYNHLYNQPSKDTFIDKDGNKRTKDGLLVPMTDKYGNPL